MHVLFRYSPGREPREMRYTWFTILVANLPIESDYGGIADSGHCDRSLHPDYHNVRLTAM